MGIVFTKPPDHIGKEKIKYVMKHHIFTPSKKRSSGYEYQDEYDSYIYGPHNYHGGVQGLWCSYEDSETGIRRSWVSKRYLWWCCERKTQKTETIDKAKGVYIKVP